VLAGERRVGGDEAEALAPDGGVGLLACDVLGLLGRLLAEQGAGLRRAVVWVDVCAEGALVGKGGGGGGGGGGGRAGGGRSG
jgi:hypothetical protein